MTDQLPLSLDDPFADDFEALCFTLGNAHVKTYPFPFFHATDVFPRAFYNTLLANLPPDDAYATHGTSYHGRRFAPADALPMAPLLMSFAFVRRTLNIFRPWLGKLSGRVVPELRLIRDGEHYFIGPHTDAPWKILSLLFYLPPYNPDAPSPDIGTSLYVPRDPDFRCEGGPHHDFFLFRRVFTARFTPNSCLGFLKTNYSFHGVEPITFPVQRDVLLWNLYRVPEQSPEQASKDSEPLTTEPGNGNP